MKPVMDRPAFSKEHPLALACAPFDVVLGAWRVGWAALILIVSAGVLYGLGVRTAMANGRRWPWWRTAAFYLLGLGSLTVLTCGFPGVYSADLRWAFTLKISLLLFVVPLLIGLGNPSPWARAALRTAGLVRLNTVLSHRVVRFFSNSLAAPLLDLALFATFLTPFFFTLRTDPVAGALLTVGVPLLGLLMALPIAAVHFVGKHDVGPQRLTNGQAACVLLPGTALHPRVRAGENNLHGGLQGTVMAGSRLRAPRLSSSDPHSAGRRRP
ncbi:cytochrome c oxidase assembly factor CtaG [Arthrobacter sp. UYEF6]